MVESQKLRGERYYRWVQRTVLVSTLLFAAFDSEVHAAAGERQYDPVVRIGAATGWKNILFVIWNHQEPRSAWALTDILRPLTDEISKKTLTVMLYQTAGPDPSDLKAASFLLCVPVQNYGTMIVRYLDLLHAKAKPPGEKEIRDLVVKAGKGLNLPKRLDECAAGDAGAERSTALNVFRETLARQWPQKQMPEFILNGRQIEVRDASGLRAQLLRQ
jgi:hypothetical protein